LVERHAIIAIVNPRDDVVGADVLVVRHRHRRDVAGHLRRHRERARRDKGVIRRLEAPGVIPVDVSDGRGRREEDRADDDGDRVPAQQARVISPLISGGLMVRLHLFRLRDRARFPVRP
jgi:hypothetical protein